MHICRQIVEDLLCSFNSLDVWQGLLWHPGDIHWANNIVVKTPIRVSAHLKLIMEKIHQGGLSYQCMYKFKDTSKLVDLLVTDQFLRSHIFLGRTQWHAQESPPPPPPATNFAMHAKPP